jgi:hypothetical protein
MQLQNRLRLDIPALADPIVQDMLDESNRFVTSFASSANNALTPTGLFNVISDMSQLISQAIVLYSLLRKGAFSSMHLLTVALVLLPRFPNIFRRLHDWFIAPDDDWPDELFSQRASALKRRICQMETMAYSAALKAEVVLFGLADWILIQWLDAKKADMQLDRTLSNRGVFVAESSSKTTVAMRAFVSECYAEALELLRQVKLVPE